MNVQLLAASERHSAPVGMRRLTAAEIKYDCVARPLFHKAARRFELFKILEWNFQDWKKYQTTLLTPGYDEEDYPLRLGRLLFNFLAAAYALTQHFEVAYRQRHRRDPEKLESYNSFMEAMLQKNWTVAFLMDFRDYVQHCGLPIGCIQRDENAHGTSLSITHNAANLLQLDPRGWKRSHLSAQRGEIDLIDLTSDYFQLISHEYGLFMADAFCPDLKDAHSFYARLTDEVHTRYPTARMIFVVGADMTAKGPLASLKITTEHPPNDLFGELGIGLKD